MRLYHATAEKNLPGIRKDGLHPGSCLTSWPEMAEYYAETIVDEDETPVILEVDIEDLDRDKLRIDRESLAEPIMTVIREVSALGLKASESDVRAAFKASGGDAAASLEIVGSCVYEEAIAPAKLIFPDSEPRLTAELN